MSDICVEEGSVRSADGARFLHTMAWLPAEGVRPRAVCQLSHGMCEYVRRYDGWARRFAAAGFLVCGHDHAGHGGTAPSRDDLGYTAARGGAEMLVDDLLCVREAVHAARPDLPVVLYGHSMGSFVARAALTRGEGLYRAALISGTAGPDSPTGLGLKVAHALEFLRGTHHRSRFLTRLAFFRYNHDFRDEKDPDSWLTRDAAVRRAYADDPYCRFVFTTAGYETLFSLLASVSDPAWAEKVPKTLPILLFSGDADPVGGRGEGVRAVGEMLRAAGCREVEVKLYPGGRHEMHNEINRDEVFADLLGFLDRALAQEGGDGAL